MTEEEAKTKWCPAYRVATSGGDPSSTFEMDNRPEVHTDGTPEQPPKPTEAWWPMACCVGSRCMAWRWTRDALRLDMDATGPILRPDRGDELHGHCGLAGQP